MKSNYYCPGLEKNNTYSWICSLYRDFDTEYSLKYHHSYISVSTETDVQCFPHIILCSVLAHLVHTLILWLGVRGTNPGLASNSLFLCWWSLPINDTKCVERCRLSRVLELGIERIVANMSAPKRGSNTCKIKVQLLQIFWHFND